MAPRKITTTIESDPNGTFTATTDKGRKMLWRELTCVEEFRLNSILGSQDSTNPTTSLHAQVASGVREIDGVPWMFPQTRQNLENAIERLGRDGLKTLMPLVIERLQIDNPEDEAEQLGN